MIRNKNRKDQPSHSSTLRSALQKNDIETFKKLINNVDLEYSYPYPDYKTCLEMAVSDPKKIDFVKLLLQHRVQINTYNITGSTPIHFAIDNGNKEALKLLLEDARIDVNIKWKGNTPLLMAIKQIENIKYHPDRCSETPIYEDMIEMLLKAGCNANAPDLKNNTPVSCAAKQKLEKVINLIFTYSKDPIDLDTYKNADDKTARDFLKEAFPHLFTHFPQFSFSDVVDNDKLFSYLNNGEEDKFVRDFIKLVEKGEHQGALEYTNSNKTMLQQATEKGFDKAVETLLLSGADPNANCSDIIYRPIAIACQKGFYNIVEMFTENDNTLLDPINDESLVTLTIKGMQSYSENSETNHKRCLQILLNHQKYCTNIDHIDKKQNTALHYAARMGDNDTVLMLLRKEACIGIRNIYNEPPLGDIHAKTIETYLDECLTTNGGRLTDDDYEVQINYSFLVYSNVNTLKKDLTKERLIDNVTEYDAILAPETDAILYMTRNEELRPLLKHPVITSFLYLKWQRISFLFYANITLYSLLWFCLILYIILGYGIEYKEPNSIQTFNVFTHTGVIFGLIFLIIRELCQLLVAPIRYLQNTENWMEIALIIVTSWIVCYDSAPESTKQQLSAVAILLSSAELVLLIGQFPTLSTNIVMLRTVSWNFFKFLLWYCILIIAFALSFYTLFRQEINDDKNAPNPNCTKKEEDEEEDLFVDPGRSLFKTIIMLTGELDAGSIKFGTFPVTSYIIFILFVFMIPIVLFNLLNGLAVNDTQAIRADAELVGHISRIKLISHFESVLIGNAAWTSKLWKWLPTYIQRSIILKFITSYIETLAKRITLFPHFLPEHRIIVIPNQEYKIVIPKTTQKSYTQSHNNEDIEGHNHFEYLKNYTFDKSIVKNAKIVISAKTEVLELDEIKNKLCHCETKISKLQNLLEKVLEKLESLPH
ncbi:transient receptor potential cation channel protein painless-like [Galleria mellonella]|uniref:Transient receptor potential cation channel protein painless-like n=1 Tax=Galleria mellonella TaxID=7137 RepID=A0A6J1WDC8_GALME|nr:transient receptor potential cation channel protein painless-like [Galleria mellonella]XP_052758298.1 transient receptor potential cation channel protein painless-like [Galleria mellonella]